MLSVCFKISVLESRVSLLDLIEFVVSADTMGPVGVNRWRDQPQTIFYVGN